MSFLESSYINRTLASQNETLGSYGGEIFLTAALTLFDPPDLPRVTDDINEWLTSNLVLSVPCENNTCYHRFVWLSDGSVNYREHDEETVQGELLLSDLNGTKIGCFVVKDNLEAACWERQIGAPRQIFGANKGMRGDAGDNFDAVVLACARAWAQVDPDLDPQVRMLFLSRRVFPSDWKPYSDAGVSVETAISFLQIRVPFEAAQSWLPKSGTPNSGVLKAAARGETNIDPALCKQHRIGLKLAQQWTGKTRLSVPQAAALHHAGYSSSMVEKVISAHDTYHWTAENLLEWAGLGFSVSQADISNWMYIHYLTAKEYKMAGFSSSDTSTLTKASFYYNSGKKKRFVSVVEIKKWLTIKDLMKLHVHMAVHSGMSVDDVIAWGPLPKFTEFHNSNLRSGEDTVILQLKIMQTMTHEQWKQYLPAITQKIAQETKISDNTPYARQMFAQKVISEMIDEYRQIHNMKFFGDSETEIDGSF